MTRELQGINKAIAEAIKIAPPPESQSKHIVLKVLPPDPHRLDWKDEHKELTDWYEAPQIDTDECLKMGYVQLVSHLRSVLGSTAFSTEFDADIVGDYDRLMTALVYDKCAIPGGLRLQGSDIIELMTLGQQLGSCADAFMHSEDDQLKIKAFAMFCYTLTLILSSLR